LSETVS